MELEIHFECFYFSVFIQNQELIVDEKIIAGNKRIMGLVHVFMFLPQTRKIIMRILKILGLPFASIVIPCMAYLGCIMTWGLVDPKTLRINLWKDYWNTDR